MKIAFIGLGKMGLPMAERLASAGHRLNTHDASSDRRALARQRGMTVFESIADAAHDCDIVLSSLPHDAALLSVAVELAACLAPASIHADTSTVSLTASARAGALLAAAGIGCLRAPVSGNAPMAEAGALTVIISGPEAAHRRVQALWPALGPKHFYVGPADEARLMKLVINLMVAQTSAMLAEALTLGRAGGLDWVTMWSVISDSAAGSPIVRAKASLLSRRDFSPTFTVTQMRKDLGLIADAASALGVSLPINNHVGALLASATDAGWADEDYAALIRVVERTAGLGEPFLAPAKGTP